MCRQSSKEPSQGGRSYPFTKSIPQEPRPSPCQGENNWLVAKLPPSPCRRSEILLILYQLLGKDLAEIALRNEILVSTPTDYYGICQFDPSSELYRQIATIVGDCAAHHLEVRSTSEGLGSVQSRHPLHLTLTLMLPNQLLQSCNY